MNKDVREMRPVTAEWRKQRVMHMKGPADGYIQRPVQGENMFKDKRSTTTKKKTSSLLHLFIFATHIRQ